MYDFIYVPLGVAEVVKKRRQELISEFVEQGWKQHGIVELQDNFGVSMQVQVLMRAIT